MSQPKQPDPAFRNVQLSRRSRQTERTIEGYLMTGGPPRWMERFMAVENGIKRERRKLAERYEALRGRPDFAERWTAFAKLQRFDELNELIRQHNTYYPIERDLPMNPRTGEYILVHGRSFLREPLTTAWVLREFPPPESAG